MPFKLTIIANGYGDPQVFDVRDPDTLAAYDFGNDIFSANYGRRRPNGELSPLGTLTVTEEEVTRPDGRTANRFTFELDPAEALELEAGEYQVDWLRIDPASSPAVTVNFDTGTFALVRGVSE